VTLLCSGEKHNTILRGRVRASVGKQGHDDVHVAGVCGAEQCKAQGWFREAVSK
jgi:hypothetical protein